MVDTQPTPASGSVHSKATTSLKDEQGRSFAYRELRTRIENAGLFKADNWHKGYIGDLTRYTLLAVAAAGLYFG
jgi:hypothetical protein